MTFSVFAQDTTHTIYDPHTLFSPIPYGTSVNISRAATGEPNIGYWQNKADYLINVSLDDVKNEISGSVTITYKNNSPHPLSFLWMQLDQNLFNKDSRGQARMPVGSRSRYGDANSSFSGGYKILSVKLINDKSNADYIIEDTRMQVRLPKPVKAAGDVIKITLNANPNTFPIGHSHDEFGKPFKGICYTCLKYC